MKWQAVAIVIGLVLAGGVAFALWASGSTSATNGCNTTLAYSQLKFEYDIEVVDATGCDKNDWLVINSGGGNEECKRVDVVDGPDIVFYGMLANDHSEGEPVVEVPYCPTPEDCDDGIDNDLDGMVDCEDPDCEGHPACELPPEDCDDGIDNDLDGMVDCADPDCEGDPACEPTPGGWECGTYGALEPWPDAFVILNPDWGPPGTPFDVELTDVLPNDDDHQPVEVLWAWDAEEQGGWLIGLGAVPQHETATVVQATVPEDAAPPADVVAVCWWHSSNETWYYQSASFQVGEEAPSETPTPEPTAAPTPSPTPGPELPPAVGQMCNCPQAGSWSLTTWQGAPINDASGALATCGEGAIEAAYALGPSGQWLRWFRDRPEISNLSALSDTQGLIALGAEGATSSPIPEPGCTVDPTMAGQGVMRDCPPPGGWSLAVWQGPDGVDAAEALSKCPDWGYVQPGAAYSLAPDNQTWVRWFDGRLDISTLTSLASQQAILTLGGPGPAPPMPEMDPSLVEQINEGPPDAPSNLVATNVSSGEAGFGGYAISIAWQDNSDNESYFVITAADTPQYPGSKGYAFSIEVDANTKTYFHPLSKPQDPDDRFCYTVRAVRELPLKPMNGAPTIFSSDPSNTACAYYDPRQEAVRDCPDSDDDFVCDDNPDHDKCDGTPGIPPNGCPDTDGDGVPWLIDECEGVKGAAYQSDDNGPKAAPGCPVQYQLRYMAFVALNNTYPGRGCYGSVCRWEGEPPSKEDCSGCMADENLKHYYAHAEEPYLNFTWVNGRLGGGLDHEESRWCCGERVLTDSAPASYEPDTDDCGEEHKNTLAARKKAGQLIWPLLDYDNIAPKYGLHVTVGLLERDYKVKVATDMAYNAVYQQAIDDVDGTAMMAIKRLDAGQSFSYQDWSSVVSALISIIQLVYESFKVEYKYVDDPDDALGVKGFGFTEESALELTRHDGAYGFYIQVPSDDEADVWNEMLKTYWYKTEQEFKAIYLEYVNKVGHPWTKMRAKVYFCLVREGVPEDDMIYRCSIPNWQPMKPLG